MQKLIILKPESIVQYKSMIGVILDNEDDKLTFSTGHKIYRIKEKDVKIPSNEDRDNKLLRDEDLKYLAYEHDIIDIQHRDKVDTYLSYVASYN
jgi:hypothetical protein